jgi:DNA-binding MarR family transcriptional regulator
MAGPGGRTNLKRRNHAAEAADSLRRIMRALRTSARKAESRLGVTGAQLFVLQILVDAPDLSLNDLAARTVTHQSTVSTVVDRLVRRGLVTKSRSADDARRLVLRLTPKGRALVRRSPEMAQGRLLEGLRRLPAADSRELTRVLRRLVSAMGATREPAEMFFQD